MKIADMHCDTISRIYEERKKGYSSALRANSFQLDLEKMKKAGYLIQNFAMFVDLGKEAEPYEACKSQIAVFQEEMEKNRDYILPVQKFSDILENEKNGRMSALMTLEEGEVCGGDIKKLEEFYQLGIRMMTFTWNYPNSLGFPGEPADCPRTSNISFPKSSAGSNAPKHTDLQKPSREFFSINTHSHGLTALGIEFLSEMERLGIIADVSHLSDEGIGEVCRFATKPFCASHSNPRALCHRGRNLPDELIRGIAEHGGIMGINYYGPFLTKTPSPDKGGCYYGTVSDIARHIQYLVNLGGIACVGLGSDFDGIDNHLELTDCSRMELLETELKRMGFHESEIEQIFYRNVLHFYRSLL